MLQRIGIAWHAIRRRPVVSSVIALLVVSAVAWYVVDFQAYQAYQQAQYEIREENYADARIHLQQCRRLPWWRNTDTFFLAARLERLLGRYGDAQQLLSECLGRSQGGLENGVQLERALLEAESGCGQGRHTPAEKELREFVKDHPDHPEAVQIWRTLAVVTFKQNLNDQAFDAVTHWLLLKPNSAEALEYRGMIKARKQDYADAEKDFRQAMALSPRRQSGRFLLAKVLLLTKGDTKEIASHLDTLLRDNPNSTEYLLVRAQCQMLDGKFAEGDATLEKLLELDPDNAPAMQLRGELQFQAGNFTLAESWTQEAIDHGMFSDKVFMLLADSLARQKDPKKVQQAQKYYAKAEALKANSERIKQLMEVELAKSNFAPEKMVELGKILIGGGSPEVGESWLHEAIKKDPANKAAHQALAKYYAKRNPEKSAQHAKLASSGESP